MTQIHNSRPSNHPFIETVWDSKNVTDGTYVATPDGAWDLIVMIEKDGSRQVMLTGQATKPTTVPYRAGTGSVVISFIPGAYLSHLTGEEMIDLIEMLPNFDETHFNLAGHTFEIPSYDTVELLVEKMITAGILKHDNVVDTILEGDQKAISPRVAQRHFVKATGMTQSYLMQIRRAQEAVRLLQKGEKPIDVALNAGYSDQPHLAKSLKKIMGSSPSNVNDIHKL